MSPLKTSSTPQIILLAAGLGQRLGSKIPKPLQLLDGKPLIVHALERLRALHPVEFVLVLGHAGNAIRDYLEQEQKHLLEEFSDFRWAYQTQPLGTAHAVQVGMEALSPIDSGLHPVLIAYVDIPYIKQSRLEQLLDAFNVCSAGGVRSTICWLMHQVEDPSGLGRMVVEDSSGLPEGVYRLTAIVEERDATLEEKRIRKVWSGFLCGTFDVLKTYLPKIENENQKREYYLTTLPSLLRLNQVPCVALDVPWGIDLMGINHLDELMTLHYQIQFEKNRELQKRGLYIRDVTQFELRGQLSFGQDVHLDIGVLLEGDNEIESDVAIGPFCVLKNVRIRRGARILPFSHLEDVVVGENAVVGPYARLRPGTVLGSSVRVGNFVEIKASHIAEYTKINHLSYVGDARVGAYTNIGAGTVTCNYDGKRKHTTLIGDHVFLGGHSTLVAPIQVGAYARTGAGTTLFRDVAPHQRIVNDLNIRVLPPENEEET